MGRPSKIKRIKKKALDQLCAALEIGASYKIAAMAAKIDYGTFNNWRKRGEAEAERLEAAWEQYWQQVAAHEADPKHVDHPVEPTPLRAEVEYLEFFHRTEEAIATCAVGDLQVIEESIMRDRSAYWASRRLAWRFPETFGEFRRTELTGKDGGPIQTETAQVVITLPDNGRGDRLEGATASS